MGLKTDWIRIGTSGATADGRTIEPQWLDEMAQSYDPAEYTALIWPDHMRFMGNFGKVAELKAEDDDKGRRALFARIEPKPILTSYNRAGNYLFASMEISPKNFAKTGKRYLVGLGVTDEPAAMAVAELQLSSKRKQHPDNQISDWCEMGACIPTETPAEAAPKWFSKFIKSFGTPDKAGEDEMTEEQLKQLTETLSAAYAKNTTELMSGLKSLLESDTKEAESARFAALENKIDELTQELEKLKNMPVNGTLVPENDGNFNQEDFS